MLKSVRPEAIQENVFKLIGRDWLLVTAGSSVTDGEGNGRVNTMTASWGGMGILWNKPVATVYLRPSRYTKELVDSSETFSLSVLPEKYRSALDYCGKHSGRDGDKISAARLSVEYMNETPWIAEARLVFVCRKLYAQELNPFSFTDELVCRQNYRKDDFHTMYIGEILKVMVDAKDLKK
ncbi:MAG: flavin reductase family protein [Treponema sp.]|nr:flavin reductase family protein [Treponema sp.]